jgi:hypothetical protein
MSAIAETILVVEDEDELRRLIEQLLVFYRFQALAGGHGMQAPSQHRHTSARLSRSRASVGDLSRSVGDCPLNPAPPRRTGPRRDRDADDGA